MKTKSFKEYIEKRINKKELAEIYAQAELEVKILRSFHKLITETMDDYMKKNEIGFNEMVRRLNSNATQISKIQKGQANLTLASLAHLSALLGQEPTLIFKKK